MPRLSISSWSLHRMLGEARYEPDGAGGWINRSGKTGAASLLDLPGQVAAHGIHAMEACHFHFPTADAAWLAEFRSALSSAGVELFSLLIDTGDLTHPDPARRAEDLRTVREWIEAAGRCGASHARVIAGDTDADAAAVERSAQTLRDLARFGRDCGVGLMTENFRRLARRPKPLLEILDRCEGEVGLCADFGNFPAETRQQDLAAVLPYADSIHAKADYDAGEMDRAGFRSCLDLSRQANFDGPYVLIFSSPGDEWENLETMKAEVYPYL